MGLFEKDFESGEEIPYNLGRLKMSSGNIMRLLFTPDGLKPLFPRSSMTNGDLLFFNDETGFGIMPENEGKQE